MDEDSSLQNQIVALVTQISTNSTDDVIIFDEGIIKEIISQDKYTLCFLKYLNRIRGDIITSQSAPFTLICNILLGILDMLYKHNGKFRKVHSEICNYIIMIAQTVYKEEKKDNNILCEFIYKHPLWKTEIWWNVILYVLFQDQDTKTSNNEHTSDKSELQSRREYLMILSVLISFKCSMISFHCDDKLYIIENIAKCYDIKDKI